MPFSKAKPEQARLKVSIYGPPGSGKTFTTLLFAEGLAKVRGKRVAYVDTERGTDFYAQAVKERAAHPAAFDFDALYTRSLADVIHDVRALDPKTHGVVVLDSISHLWEAAIDAFEGRRTKADTIPMHAWGKIKKPYKDLIKHLIESPFDVFILGRQKNVFEDDDKGEMKKVGVAMRAEGETPYEPHICARMFVETNPEDSAQSRYVALFEKDRTGVLAGKRIVNPTFAVLEALLPLLGERQATSETDEDRAERDASLLDEQDDKARAKADKSAGAMKALLASVQGATTLAELGKIADEIKKTRGLVDEHKTTLREIYRQRREELAGREAAEL